jgi:hypothetical protein
VHLSHTRGCASTLDVGERCQTGAVTARILSFVTDELSPEGGAASEPATAQTFTLREALTMACKAALVGQAVHQLCEQRRYTVAVHVGGAAPPTPSPDKHARKGGDENDGEG